MKHEYITAGVFCLGVAAMFVGGFFFHPFHMFLALLGTALIIGAVFSSTFFKDEDTD